MSSKLNPQAIPGFSEATSGQVLSKSSSGEIAFVDQGGGGSGTLEGLSDVNISLPSSGQPLQYDSTSGKWVNASTIDPHTLPTFSTASIGQVLVKNGSDTTAFATVTGVAPAYVSQTGIQAPESDYYTKGQTDTLLSGKQDVLVSGSTIKTLNSETLLGNGDISIPNLSFHHKRVTDFNSPWTFDDVKTDGYNRCYYYIDATNNANITLAFTNTDEHYLLIHNAKSSGNVTMSIVTVAGFSMVGNTAIEIGAGEYFEISLIKSGTAYVVTERKLTSQA